jgi:hypothetical protein
MLLTSTACGTEGVVEYDVSGGQLINADTSQTFELQNVPTRTYALKRRYTYVYMNMHIYIYIRMVYVHIYMHGYIHSLCVTVFICTVHVSVLI